MLNMGVSGMSSAGSAASSTPPPERECIWNPDDGSKVATPSPHVTEIAEPDAAIERMRNKAIGIIFCVVFARGVAKR